MRPVRSWRDALTLVGFLTPALALLGVFTIWPAVWAIYQSFTNKALTGFEARSPHFVGLQNYTRLLGDPDFHSSMLRTFAFVLLSAVVGQTIFAFAIAYLMAERPRWRLGFTPLFAAVFLLPLAVPEAVISKRMTGDQAAADLANKAKQLLGPDKITEQ